MLVSKLGTHLLLLSHRPTLDVLMANPMLCVVSYIVGKQPFTNKLFRSEHSFPHIHSETPVLCKSFPELSAWMYPAGSSRSLSARTHATGASRPFGYVALFHTPSLSSLSF